MMGGMDQSEHLLGVGDLAAYLQVPVATIYTWRHHGVGPPGFRAGRHVRFRWVDVQAWIEQQIDAGRPTYPDCGD